MHFTSSFQYSHFVQVAFFRPNDLEFDLGKWSERRQSAQSTTIHAGRESCWESNQVQNQRQLHPAGDSHENSLFSIFTPFNKYWHLITIKAKIFSIFIPHLGRSREFISSFSINFCSDLVCYFSTKHLEQSLFPPKWLMCVREEILEFLYFEQFPGQLILVRCLIFIYCQILPLSDGVPITAVASFTRAASSDSPSSASMTNGSFGSRNTRASARVPASKKSAHLAGIEVKSKN